MEITLENALQKGIDAHKAGELQEADRYYTAILKAQPKHPDANHNMGVLALDVNKVQEALTFFKTALEANPDTAQYWLSYIEALIRLELFDDVQSVLAQARKKDINVDSLARLESKAKNKKQKTVANEDPPQERLTVLIDLYKQGQLQALFSEALQLLTEFPRSSMLYNMTGTANQAFGKLDEAVVAYKKAISLKPDSAEVYNNMGNTLKAQSKLDEAVVAYKKAIGLKPDSAEFYNNIGNTLKAQSKLDEAVVAYKKAININSDIPEIYNNLGIALREQSKLEEAVEAFNAALSIKPDYAEVSSNLGECMIHLGQLDEGKSIIRKADGSISL